MQHVKCLPDMSDQGREIHRLYIALVTAPAHKNALDLLCVPVAVDGCAHDARLGCLGVQQLWSCAQEFWQSYCSSGDRGQVKSGKRVWQNLGMWQPYAESS